jgi:hypothetical protein
MKLRTEQRSRRLIKFVTLLAIHQIKIDRRAIPHCEPYSDLRFFAEPETHSSIRASTNVEGFICYGLLGTHNVLKGLARSLAARRRK